MSLNRRALLSLMIGGVAASVSSKVSAQAAESTGIIFVGASWCPVCKQASPMLDVFAQRHNIPILVASHDARPITPFTEFVDARDHPIASSVRAFPTTFVFSSRTQEIVGGFEGYRSPQWYLGNLLDLVRQSEGIS